MTRLLGLITFSFVMIGGFYAQRVFSETCTLAGTWTQDSEGLGQSTWEITADGEATESGLGNAKGRATLGGGKLRIDWTIPGYNNSGYYEWTLDSSCRTGSGIAVNTVSGVTRKTTVTKAAAAVGAISVELQESPPEVWVGWGRDSMAVSVCITGFNKDSSEPLRMDCPDMDNSFGDHFDASGDRLKTVRIVHCGETAASQNWAGHPCSTGPGYHPTPGYLWGVFISAPAVDPEPLRLRDICIGTNPVTLRFSQNGAGEAFVTLQPELVLKARGIGGGGTYGPSNCSGDSRGPGGGGTGGGGTGGGGSGGGPRGPVVIQTANGHYLTAVRAGGIQGPGAIHSDATTAGGWETFEFVSLPDGKYAIKTANGNYLTAMRGGGVTGPDVIHTDAQRVDEWEKFTLQLQADGTYAIQTSNGNYLTALNGGGIGGGRPAIHSNATSVGGWEKFKLVAIGGTGRSVDYDSSSGSTGALPFAIQECETYGATACGVWTLNGNQFDARWDNGATATLTIERFDDNEVIINRRDRNQDFAARYVGRRVSGNKIEGTVTWTAGGRSWSGTWTASW